jgi:hypothetical protein
MTPREIIGQWLQSAPWVHDPFGPWTEVADDLLKALDEQGMAVVPKEPTNEMMMAGYSLVGDLHYLTLQAQGWGDRANVIYKAMIEKAK